MTDRGRVPESGLSPYVHALEANLANLRESMDAYDRLLRDAETQRDVLLSTLRKIETWDHEYNTPEDIEAHREYGNCAGCMARAAIDEVKEV